MRTREQPIRSDSNLLHDKFLLLHILATSIKTNPTLLGITSVTWILTMALFCINI